VTSSSSSSERRSNSGVIIAAAFAQMGEGPRGGSLGRRASSRRFLG
jgi:hypothetical protein